MEVTSWYEMVVTNCYITNPNNDYYSHSINGVITGTTTLHVLNNEFVIPNYTEIAYGIIDTSIIPIGKTITGATFKFDAPTYTATKGVTKTFNVWIWNGSSYTILGTGTWTSAGTYTINFTPSQLAYIGTTTILRITVPSAGANKYRYMQVYAYENSQITAMRMDVTTEDEENFKIAPHAGI